MTVGIISALSVLVLALIVENRVRASAARYWRDSYEQSQVWLQAQQDINTELWNQNRRLVREMRPLLPLIRHTIDLAAK